MRDPNSFHLCATYFGSLTFIHRCLSPLRSHQNTLTVHLPLKLDQFLCRRSSSADNLPNLSPIAL